MLAAIFLVVQPWENLAYGAEYLSPYAHAVAANPSLIDYWRLNEQQVDKVAANQVPGRPAGTYFGDVVKGTDGYFPGMAKSAQFDGASGTYIDVGQVDLSGITNQFTIETWVYLETCASGIKTIVAKPGTFALYVNCNTKQAEMDIWWPGTDVIGKSAALELGKWHHIVGTYDGTTITVYADVRTGATATVNRSFNHTNDTMKIGASRIGSGTNSYNWHGKIDEVAIYSTALSKGDVRDHYVAGLDVEPYRNTLLTKGKASGTCGIFGQKLCSECTEKFGFWNLPQWGECKRTELICKGNMKASVGGALCKCETGLNHDGNGNCVEGAIAAGAACGKFGLAPCQAGGQLTCSSDHGLNPTLGVCKCATGSTVDVNGNCTSANGTFGFADFVPDYFLNHQIGLANVKKPDIFMFTGRASEKLLPLDADSLSWIRGYAPGTCLTGIVDTKNHKMFVYPVAAVTADNEYSFNCQTPVAIAGKTVSPANPIVHTPRVNGDANHGASHVQLMYRRVANLPAEETEFSYVQGIGFFLKKVDQRNFVIDYSSRSLNRNKFSYNGGVFYGTLPCGNSNTPRCYPTKSWRDIIRDSLDQAINRRSLPTDCTHISNGSAGIFILYFDGRSSQPYQAYCTASGATYLELAETNYSSEVSVCKGNVRTEWSKIRFNTATKTVIVDDFKFTRSQGTIECWKWNQVKYGSAGDCLTNNSNTGKARIDLSGLPFAVDLSTDWRVSGWYPNGSIDFTDDRTQVDITGGGYCGGQAVDGPLKLEYFSNEDRGQVVFDR